MKVELGGHSLREARAIAHRFLEQTATAIDPKIDHLEPWQATIARERERAKDRGTTRLRATLMHMLAEWRAAGAAIVDRRLGARASESLRESGDDERKAREDTLDEIVRDLFPDEAVGLAIEDELHALFEAAVDSVQREHAFVGAKVGTSFSAPPVAALKALDAIEMQFSRQIVERERAGLKALVRQSLDEGWSNPDLAKEIKAFFAQGIHYVDERGAVVRTMPSDAWATMVARTESSRAYNEGSLATYRSIGVERLRWIAAEDERTCFAATTRVTAADGTSVSIMDASDVLTPFGARRVVARMNREYTGDWILAQAQGHLLMMTIDHPIWASGSWREAGDLVVGDVLQTDANEFVEIDRIAYIALTYTNDGNAAIPQGDITCAIASRDFRKRMPVVAVDLKREIRSQQKVDRVPTDFHFSNRSVTKTQQGISYGDLGSRWAAVTAIARDRAEDASLCRTNALYTTATSTSEGDYGTSATFGAKRARTPTLAGESSTAPFADDALGLGNSTGSRTDGVSMRVSRWNGELLVASGTDLRDARTNLSPIMSWLSAQRGVLTDSGTVTCETFDVRAGELDSALLAFEDNRHDLIIRSLGVAVPKVYNLAVEDDAVFFAESILVHNCPLCDVLDGETNPVGEKWPIAEVEAPPAHVLCRCTTVAVWGASPTKESDPGHGGRLGQRIESLDDA